jgi:hypothetical protein
MSSLFAVVLNWNNYQDTKECVDSLLNSSINLAGIVLVDNASTDGSPEKLKREFKDKAYIHFINNPMNYGFAKGVNVGIRFALESGADYVFLLNNDALVSTDCIEKLYEALASIPNGGIAGPRIFYYKEPQKIWAGESYFSPIKLGIYSPQKNKIDRGLSEEIKEVSFVTGCAMLIKREVFESIGLFDEDYYFYNEDVDFCLRTLKAGFKILHVPSAKVWHKIGSTSESRTSEFYMYNLAFSHILLLRKNFSGFGFIYGIFLVLLVYTPFRILQIMRGSRSSKAMFAWIRGVRDGFLKDIKREE